MQDNRKIEVSLNAVRRLKAELTSVLKNFDEIFSLGIDPNCPNCDGTGGALPNGTCGVCWNWYGDEAWEHHMNEARVNKYLKDQFIINKE